MKQITLNKRQGMTLTELLAVLLILSLLATIAVPVYVARQEDARIRVAITECRQIAQAEDTVAAMHGFYIPFQLLDDLPNNPDNDNTDEERIDSNPFAQDLFVINATIRANDQIGNQFLLGQGYGTRAFSASPANPLITKMVENWAGPFINFQRFWYDTRGVAGGGPYDGPTDPNYRNDNDMFRDFPLDPWGNPYRFYSPIGIIGDGRDEFSDFNFLLPDLQFSNGELTRNDEERFQKFAVVSFGRDGIADTDPDGVLPANAIDNDIYYEFGTDGLSPNFGKF